MPSAYQSVVEVKTKNAPYKYVYILDVAEIPDGFGNEITDKRKGEIY
jgi:hypothetical protein